MKIKRISHVAIAVPDIDAALGKLHQVLGLSIEHREVVASQKVEAALLPLGDAAVELVQSKGNDGIDRFLQARGPGLHHVCFEVDDLPAALASLKAAGVRLLDETPRLGARGHWVAFLDPAATGGVLFELCAHRGDAS